MHSAHRPNDILLRWATGAALPAYMFLSADTKVMKI